MAIAVTRRDNESADQILVRFNKKGSRHVKALRRGRYFTRNESRFKRKVAAVIREGYRSENARKKFYN